MPTGAVLSVPASSHYLCLFAVRVVISEHTADEAVSLFHAAPHSCCVTTTRLVDNWCSSTPSQSREQTQHEGHVLHCGKCFSKLGVNGYTCNNVGSELVYLLL